MLDDLRVNDVDLTESDIRALENADEIAHFFARLGYNVDERAAITNYATLSLSDDLRHHIHRIELIGRDPVDAEITIYLFEVRSVTAKLRNDIARAFRNLPENVLLVLTVNYDTLEFVMLQKSEERTRSRSQTFRLVVRPVPLTVNRQNPGAVALRVLKRFSFTEEDAAYQWDKLRSAYTLAEWGEEYYHNRALFSDYYLKHRLTDKQITPEWDEDVRPVGREVFQRMVTARKDFSGKPESVIRSGLHEPLFRLLGLDFTPQRADSSPAEAPDYLLYAPGSPDEPIAAALTYAWNRNLDDVDTTRDPATPDEIPGALVVSLLEAQVAPWVIVTNGKLWRLYCATASNKATNYYEVDLEEAIAARDQVTALKYWWLMFRRQAFEGFLDRLLKQSADYAKELGDRLKDRVFVEIFPLFAQGFIANMRAGGADGFDEESLAAVYSGTLTFLYRLMFTLYAESLDLLPVSDASGYYIHSLDRLRKEIAAVGRDVLDEAPDRLRQHYSASATTLYDRLQKLFAVIDRGDENLNMPAYNGGLFSPDTDSGRFLTTWAIPDRYLALGLDRLARDLDARTQALVFVDFKSLGVRHLGSIYEGLLEFRLRIAGETLAVTKDKGREVYQPAKQVKKPLATISKGDVYLENDRRERKATGSYYTPDYIVKYIVRHTVGPVLERKFADLEPRLRAAQRDYRQARALAVAKGEDPEKFWRLHEPTSPMSQLVDDCLNIRVLDPAMGSGHFLVEVVDTVSSRLIDFLNAWSENPVWAFVDHTRQDILDDMERQHVTIDADRLTRVALLKRAVLKRCVYGVDLNAMAVELAKVSLWLDAFTLGAPLSFLDHHLKHGNSLIGARVADVQDYLRGGEGHVQLDMFSGSEFAGVMLATDLMRQVSYLSDNTVEQARRSADQFRQARDHLAPYRRLLDVYTSRWFGNAAPKKAKADNVRLFLKDARTRDWLKDPAAPLDNMLFDASAIADTALRAAEAKRFFHWELEFPEVFFAPRTPGGQDVQLKPDGGFDAVVGNPPYGYRTIIQDSDKAFFDGTLATTQGNYDLYQFFIEQSTRILGTRGYFAYITPNTFLVQPNYEKLRKLLFSNLLAVEINDTGGNVFEDATIDTAICVFSKPSSISLITANQFTVRKLPNHENTETDFSQADYADGMILSLSASGPGLKIIQSMKSISYELQEYFYCTVGINTGYIKDVLISDIKVDDRYHMTISGSDIDRYSVDWQGEWICYDKELVRSYGDKGRSLPPEHIFTGAKILLQRTRNLSLPRRLVAYLDTNYKYYNLNRLSNIVKTSKDVPVHLEFLTAVLNSTMMNWYFEQNFVDYEIKPVYLRQLPIRRIDFTTPADERQRRAQAIISAYASGDHTQALQQAQAALAAGQTDVVHDVLAHLAQRMIDLNKQKQAEVKRFLGWLETRLKIQPKNGEGGIASLGGRTIIQGYLGDYQKGQAERPWRDFLYRLHQNRARFAVSLADVEGEIERAYEHSLAALLPVKRDLARTDALIDRIVYRLYGLTDAEIELIERPQYEQALTDAKASVVGDDKSDDETKIEKIAEGILSASSRFFGRVEPRGVEAALDTALPRWRDLPPDAPTFLLTGDYNLSSLPDHMDFSSSVIPYTKAVEVVLHRRFFEPFRAAHSADDCRNEFLQKFMRGEKSLTLGSYMIILSSSKETALRSFMGRSLADVDGLVTILNDDAMRDVRNKAAHDEVLTRDEAQQTRAWAIGILGML
jgi:hypothetical protein